MRPIKLVMSAFGPYADTQRVDFRDATDAGLFGIYGPTGSGKSSIFSAMTFALFGEAAKREQPIGTLRSAHAPANLLTEVVFVFELGTKRYLVRRQPDQSRPKTRGEGETNHSHAAWLFDVTGVELDELDLEGCGVVLAEKKVGLVTEQIKKLLGYGADQFRQIVLLPQGRFEKFLTSDSTERLKILRDLFDVSLYRAITDKLKEEASAAKREVSDGYRVHAQRLQAEGFASSDELEDGIAQAETESLAHAEKSLELEAAACTAEQSYASAEEVERRFFEADEAAAALALVKGRQPEVDASRLRRDNALLAQRASDIFGTIAVAEGKVAQAAMAEEAATTASVSALKAFTGAEAALQAEKAREGEIEGLQRQVDELGRYKEALADAGDLKVEQDQAAAERVKAEGSVAKAVAEVARLTKLHEGAQTSLSEAQRDHVERSRLQGERTTLGARLAQARAHSKASQDLATARSESEKTNRKLISALDARSAAKERLELAEQDYFAAQASILALRLAEGEPCPVCGANEHPDPAHSGGDPQALETAWKQAREELDEAVTEHQNAREAHASARSLVAEREAALAALSAPEEPATTLESTIADIDEALQALGAPKDVALLEEHIRDAKAQLDEASAASSEADRSLQAARTGEAVARRAYEDHIADVPERYRDETALQLARAEIEESIADRKKALTEAENALRRAGEAKAKAEADLTNAKARSSDAVRDAARAREQFAARLQEIGISHQQYQTFVEEVPEIEALTAIVDEHESALRTATGAAAQASAAIKDAQRPDLDSMKATRDAARQAADAAKHELAAARAKYEGLIGLRSELSDELTRLRRLEEETGPLRALAEAFSGQNEMNTALESFAIGAMFDQVLEAANLRLEPMTSGRYRLERDVESAGGRTKRGLDIRVHDIETGRPRDLSTLSGGETFIAALSLALGLSDIVEASHGAIRLDTIFIDEGFGSLDTENDSGTLDRVLQVLQDIVGASRAVGLISHVPLVQQAVPNGFTVLKGVGGSSIEPRAA
jgi:exonuclease SbcC